MAEIDDQLREAFAKAAEPGDPSGVADALRSRMTAGDTGTPASSSGFASGVSSWLPWVGLIVVAGLIGGAAGVFGLAGRPVVVHEAGQSTGVLGAHSVALECVGGPVVASLPAGERVLAMARSDDSSWLGVRNPVTLTGTIWVPVDDVTVDKGEPAIKTLPIGGLCPVATVVTDPPVVAAPVTPVTPSKPSKPTPDTTPPTIGKPTSSINPPDYVCNNSSGYPPAIISVNASDNVGVTGVSISWTGVESGSASMGGSWSFSYHPSSTSAHGNVTFVLKAKDAAGNTSSSTSITLQQTGCVG